MIYRITVQAFGADGTASAAVKIKIKRQVAKGQRVRPQRGRWSLETTVEKPHFKRVTWRVGKTRMAGSGLPEE